MTCPTDTQLTDLLSAALPERDAQSIRQHLEKCGQCQARLDQLTETPQLARKPHSTAELAVNGLDPLLQKLKQIADQRPRPSPPTSVDSEPRRSLIPILAIVGVLLLGANVWWWTGGPPLATSKNAIDSAKLAARANIDRQFTATIAEVDLKQPEQVKQHHETLVKLLSQYRTELAEPASLIARHAEVAFRVAILSAALEPPDTAIGHLKQAITLNGSLAGHGAEGCMQQCHEHLARLFRQTEQWPQADEHLRLQINYWQPKWEARPTDMKLCRSLVALNRQLAEVRQKTKSWTGAVEACESALYVLNSAAKSAPDSPFLQQELATVQRELDSIKNRSTESGS